MSLIFYMDRTPPCSYRTDTLVPDTTLFRSAAAEAALVDCPVPWSVHQLVGDPALAMKHRAERVDAKLLVVGTRKRGFGDSLREFFTGSVARSEEHTSELQSLMRI